MKLNPREILRTFLILIATNGWWAFGMFKITALGVLAGAVSILLLSLFLVTLAKAMEE